MSEQNLRLGILYMVATTLIFAVQDTLSRHLAENYNVLMVVMIRFWFFAAFVVALAARQAGGIRAAAATKRPVIQIVRGLLLPAEVCIMVLAFTMIGLVDTHAVFVTYPCSSPRSPGRCWARRSAGAGGRPSPSASSA